MTSGGAIGNSGLLVGEQLSLGLCWNSVILVLVVLPLRLDLSPHHDHSSPVTITSLGLALGIRCHITTAVEELLVSDIACDGRLLRPGSA